MDLFTHRWPSTSIRSYRDLLRRQPELVSQPTKTDDYCITIDRTRSLDCCVLRLRNGCSLALTALVFHAGADRLEIVASSGMSHFSPLSLLENCGVRNDVRCDRAS
jgi:hypothetical protein